MWRLYRKLRKFLWRYRTRLVLGILFGIAAGLVEPLLMVSVRIVFEVMFPGSAQQSFSNWLGQLPEFLRQVLQPLWERLDSLNARLNLGLLVLVSSAIPVTMGLRGFFSYLNTYLLQWVSIRAVTDLRHTLFQKLVNRPMAALEGYHSGELISRLINDTAVVQRAILDSATVLVRDPVKLIGLTSLLFLTEPRLSLVALVVVLLCAFPIGIYNRKVRQASRALQDEFAQLSRLTQETFGGMAVVKAYNMEQELERKFGCMNHQFVSHYMRIIRSTGIPGPLIETMGAIGIAILLIYVGLTRSSTMSAGHFLQFVGTVFLMYQPIKNLTRFYQGLVQAEAASERVFEMLSKEIVMTEPSVSVSIDAAGKDIVFDHVSFSYGTKRILHNINLRIPAGQMVAIVGPSGSGKTTLANLILRLYEPDEGTIYIGSLDIRSVSIRELRRQIAVVTQEPILFDESIEHNILIGRPGAKFEEVVRAARLARADEFIIQKPQQYKTRIGERGIQLSGGERQRIAIARAILKDAPILILDEATSSLDSESERLVQEALLELTRGRTTLCIAHRLSTIRHAAMIVVLWNGKIVEVGTHDQLLKEGKYYRRLYEMQMLVE